MRDSRFGRPRRTLRFLGTWVASALLVTTQLALPVAAAPVAPAALAPQAAPAAPTSTISFHVYAARSEPDADIGPVVEGQAITTYRWMINVDNTGSTAQRSAAPGSGCSTQDAGYPASCQWASIAGLASSAPVFAQGDSSDFEAGGRFESGITLDAGRYLVSVLADGFKLDGTPFAIPADPGTIEVPLQPLPLPTATIKAQVFADVASANGQYDPGEDGLSGWTGKITDYIGQVNTDVFGNPLCTTYAFADSNGNGVQDQLWDPTWTGPAESITLTDGEPTVTHQGGKCLTGDINMDGVVNGPASTPGTDEWLYANLGLDPALARGVLTIPNLGPNRYALSMVPPTGSSWVQTTTLEGNHDWDSWVMEGATGLDTEFVVAGEPFPAQIFGYVPGPTTTYWTNHATTPQPSGNRFAAGSGTIKGVVDAMDIYIPQKGGLNLPTLGFSGAKIDHPIDKPWIALSDLNGGDAAVYVGRGNADGTFEIENVPDGTYTLTYWDDPQNYILDLLNVTVLNGETVDMGLLPMAGWFTKFDGFVFNDENRNGKRDFTDANGNGKFDAGDTWIEAGVPNFGLTLRKRENSLMDRGATAVGTDQSGHYEMVNAYPLTEWLVLEAYDDRYYTTGITYQADNQPEPTTILGAGVDVSVLPIIGLSGTLDWGVHFYDPTGANGIDPQNGGIVGSISYDTTRNELDPQYAAAEDWQPGVSGITVELWSPVDCGTNAGVPCDARGDYELAPDGSYARGKLLNTYVSETWERPSGCVARDVDGNPLVHGTDEQVLPLDSDAPCLEGPLMGVQFGPYPTDQGTADANFGAAVDGNYGFGDACIDGTLDATDPSAPTCTDGNGNEVPFTALDAADYLVHIDLGAKVDAKGEPIYKVTREEDINIGNGDTFVPQVPPPACAGALHQVDVADFGTDGYGPAAIPDPSGNGGSDLSVPASTTTDNPTFVDIGASPYEGQARPLCDTKLVTLQNGKSVVPMFNVFTDVPLPGRFFAYNVDDLNFSTDPKSLLYGEKAGLAFAPVGIYDFANRLVTTVETDYNGLFDVLLPSTNRINCPTPSGVCGNLYRFVGNDPGIPGRLNTNYNPQYRTIAAEFEAWPGIIVPADTAPTQVGVSVQLPGAQTIAISCPVNDPAAAPATRTPELYAVSRPYVTGTGQPFTISGFGFGATKGTGQVTLDGAPIATSSWNDTTIVVPSVAASFGNGPHQLRVTAANGKSTVNGLTFHRIGGTYNPQVFEVGPGKTYAPANSLPATADHAIQRALDAAATFVSASSGNANRGALVVVYPNNPAGARLNPRGAYYENLVISGKVKLQGVGPGSPDGSVRGSIIDGGAFGGDGPVATDWYAKIGTLSWAGNQAIYDGAVISIYVPNDTNAFTTAERRRAFPTTYNAMTAPSIDGFDLRGGDQMGFPGNITEIGGVPTGLPAGLITQGGAVFANAWARNLQITNNVVQNNGGAYGTIRIGTPDLPAPDTDAQNDGVRILNNRIVANAGTNLAGGIGFFAGSDGYVVSGNDICGNFSAEYGGGVSAYGLSPNGSIDHNRIYYNQSYDEGGGIMIAGQLPTDPSIPSPGSGAVTIHDNVVQANMANDDGGGIRFLMAGNFPMNVYNNMIVNNVSTHEGGGIALDDAPNVRVYNNTIMKNITTATAVTSDGQPAPAGLSTGANSSLLQPTLPGGSPLFSNPLLFNNIFWDNRAGTRVLGTVTGIGAGDANHWDLGALDPSILLAPTNSIVQQNAGTYPYTSSPTNSAGDPLVSDPYDTVLSFAPWRTNPNFLGAILVAADLPPKVLGDYHILTNTSPAYNGGAANKAVPASQTPPATLAAPTTDIDGQARPAFGGFDTGADEIPAPTADLSITKSDGVDSVNPGATVTYTVVVTNGGPFAVTAAPVADTFPAALTVGSWTCSASAGSSCTTAGSGNARTGTVTLLSGGTATYTATTTLAATAGATLANTATVAAPAGISDPNTSNNTATDTDTVVVPLPALTVLDTFNRANASTLNAGAPAGVSWSQTTTATTVIRVNGNQANCALVGNCLLGQAIWNGTTNVFGATQGAAITINSAPATAALFLKASGGAANAPQSYIRVRYASNQVMVETTANGGGSYTTRGTLAAATFASGNTLTARANADGSVDVWQNATYLGRVTGTTLTGTGRIGMQLLVSGQAENFSGGTLP